MTGRQSPAPLMTASALAEIERIICELQAIDPEALPSTKWAYSPRFCFSSAIRSLEATVKLAHAWENQGRKGRNDLF